MSAVAMPYDSTFALGPRPAPYSWPTLDSHSNSTFGPELASIHHGSEASMTPPSVTSSLTSSPPLRFTFTPEQRELKRQRDRARHDSRLASRLRRVSSQAYLSSPPPMPIPDVTSAMEMAPYSHNGAHMPLLSESSPALAPQPYLPSYSPPMQDPVHASSQVFPTPYGQSMHQGYGGMPMEYQSGHYGGSAAYSSRSSSCSVGQEAGLMYQVPAVMTSGGPSGSPSASHESGHVRVVQSRPKPRCWEHGCNGRQFSTFSNLLRHQREKSGQATKASCPNCGAEFTRTTARNGHMLHDKCKQRRNS